VVLGMCVKNTDPLSGLAVQHLGKRDAGYLQNFISRKVLHFGVFSV
jgi:hypothetical protein